MFDQNPNFTSLLQQMSKLTWMPLDARDQFDAMLRANFTGNINDEPQPCPRCEALPGDNDHCIWDDSPHAWHVCGEHLRTAFIDSNCPTAAEKVAR
jgi:hypothetical protein